MAAPIITNEKPAEAMTPGGLVLVLTTLSPTPGKDQDSDLIHIRAAPFKPR